MGFYGSGTEQLPEPYIDGTIEVSRRPCGLCRDGVVAYSISLYMKVLENRNIDRIW